MGLGAGVIHKIGWRGLPSVALALGDDGDCVGWLVGPPHQGLRCMFQMMNEARLMVGVNAAATASVAFHEAVAWAQERRQGRALGVTEATVPPEPLVQHPDVRRMLLRQKAIVEGSLAAGRRPTVHSRVGQRPSAPFLRHVHVWAEAKERLRERGLPPFGHRLDGRPELVVVHHRGASPPAVRASLVLVRGFLAFLVFAAIGAVLVFWAVEDARSTDAQRPARRSPSTARWPPPSSEPNTPGDVFPDELRFAEDGRWLEVFPLTFSDAGVDDDTTVIWQDESGLISVRRSKRDLQALPAPRKGEPPDDTGRRLLTEAEEALQTGHFFEARRRASLARTFLPERPETYALLGRIAAAQNDVDEARWNYERAEQYSGNKGLYRGQAKALAAQAKDVGSLRRFETEHFAVASEWAADEPNALVLRDELERAWLDVAGELDVQPRGKVQVVLYRHEQFEGRAGATAWAAGDFDGRVRITGSGVGSGRWREILLHELTHAFLHAQDDAIAPWLDEGIAQWVASRVVGTGPTGCRAGHGFPLTELRGSFSRFSSCREAHVAYLTALHAVERLVEVHQVDGLRRLLKGAGQGGTSGAFTRAFGQSKEAFEAHFDAEYASPEGVAREHPSYR